MLRYLLIALGVFPILFQVNLVGHADQDEFFIQQPHLQQNLGRISVPFTENHGGPDGVTTYCAHIFTGEVTVSENGRINYILFPRSDNFDFTNQKSPIRVTEYFANCVDPTPLGLHPMAVRVNRFKGTDRTKWARDIPCFNVVSLGEVYDGIQVELRAHGNNIEKIFTVLPGRDPEDIRIRVDGAERLQLGRTGELEIDTHDGPVSFTRPVAYQDNGDERQYVDVSYRVDGYEYGFALGAYDHTRPLIIDPLLASTYFGGNSLDGDSRVAIALDGNGHIYVASRTFSEDFFDIPAGYDPVFHGNGDVLVARLSDDLTTLEAVTYLGGRWQDGLWPGVSIALDDEGNLFVTGNMQSDDFPFTTGAYDSTYNGGTADIFISKLSPDLDELLASTYFGGAGYEEKVYLAFDKAGDVYITGSTQSNPFPVSVDAVQPTYAGDGGSPHGGDVFISRFSNDLTTLVASTYLGGSRHDFTEGIAINDAGDIYITGWEASSDFPTTPGCLDDTYNGHYYDAFASKLGPDLDTLLASTYFGGSSWDFGWAMALGNDGSVYVTGHTASGNFPRSPMAYDTTYCGGAANVGDDAFIIRLGPDLDTVLAGTFLGGNGWEIGTALLIDEADRVFITGCTNSDPFPTSPDTYDTAYHGGSTHAGDLFVGMFDQNLEKLLFSTYLGGNSNDNGGMLALDADGNLFVSAATASSDYPTTTGAYDEEYNGGSYDWGGDIVITAFPSSYFADTDEDNVLDRDDNCPETPNTDQSDLDLDSVGDLCDNCPENYNPDQTDSDGDNLGDVCDCCGQYTEGYTGNCNCDVEGKRNLADISKLIDRVYLSKAPLCCEAEGNVNGDVETKINLADISTLIDHVFLSKAQTAACL